jgi:molybdopterin-guanine dinucleotide biosynthesis protein
MVTKEWHVFQNRNAATTQRIAEKGCGTQIVYEAETTHPLASHVGIMQSTMDPVLFEGFIVTPMAS